MTNIRNCTAITNKNKPCPWNVEPWREQDLCHIHDPKGTFRIQHPPKKRKFKQPKKSYKKNVILSVMAEMLSKKCTSDPFITNCLYQDSVHCDTIDFMVDILSSNERLLSKNEK